MWWGFMFLCDWIAAKQEEEEEVDVVWSMAHSFHTQKK